MADPDDTPEFLQFLDGGPPPPSPSVVVIAVLLIGCGITFAADTPAKPRHWANVGDRILNDPSLDPADIERLVREEEAAEARKATKEAAKGRRVKLRTVDENGRRIHPNAAAAAMRADYRAKYPRPPRVWRPLVAPWPPAGGPAFTIPIRIHR